MFDELHHFLHLKGKLEPINGQCPVSPMWQSWKYRRALLSLLLPGKALHMNFNTFFFLSLSLICRLQYLLPELCRNIDLEFLDISLGSVFMVFQISTAINYWEQATSAFPFSVVNMMYFVRYPYHNLNQASIFYGKHASFISQLAWKVDLWIQRPLLLLGVLWLANSKAMENNKL